MERDQLPPYLFASLASPSNPGTFMGLSGKSRPAVVYAAREPSSSLKIRLTMAWGEKAKILDETDSVALLSFDKAATLYAGLVRLVGKERNREAWRIFDTALISSAYNLKTRRFLMGGEPRRENSAANKRPSPRRYEIPAGSSFSETLARQLTTHFGNFHYDCKRDFIDVGSIARRLGETEARVYKKILETFKKCTPDEMSGCWLSTSQTAYRNVARWKYDGFSAEDLFSHEGHGLERHVIRHHPLRCELMIKEKHNRCCRPAHLCYGSSKANSRDLQLRQAVGNVLLLFANAGVKTQLIDIIDKLQSLLVLEP